MSKLAESLFQVINQTVDARPQYQDQTVAVDIVSIVNVETGEYKVRYQSNVMSAFAQNTDNVYKVDEKVLMLVPSGDFDQRKIIIGKLSGNETYADKLDMMNFYTDAGPNWFSEDMYHTDHDTQCGICACPEDQSALLVDPANYTDIYFERQDSAQDLQADNELQWYASQYEYIKVSALFRTEFSSTHSVGNYSLVVFCEYLNPDYHDENSPLYDATVPQYKEINFELGFGEFTGSPYQYSQNTPQTAYYKVEKGTIKRLKKVGLYQDGKFLFDIVPSITSTGSQIEQRGSKVVDRNNIFCSDIDIRFAEKVNLNDGLYHAWIETPIGDRVYKANPNTGGQAKPYVDLVPHLYYMNQDYIQDCVVKWFRRNSSVMRQTPNDTTNVTGEDITIPGQADRDEFGNVWTDYTGPGWEPIENVLDNGLGDAKTEWNRVLDDGQTLRVFLEGVIWEWDYKVVCLYYTTERDSQGNEKKKLLVGGTQAYPTAEHTVVNASYDAQYSLVVGDETNAAGRRVLYVNNLLRNVKQPDLITDPTGQTMNRLWYCTWYLLGTDNSYIRITNEMAEDPVDITEYLSKDLLTFRVRAWDPYLVNPGNGDTYLDMAPVGELEYIIVNTEDSAVTYWTGDRSFNYDANGKAYDWMGIYDRAVKLNIYFPDNASNGQPGGGSYSVRMLAPDGVEIGLQNIYKNDENPELSNGYTPPNGKSMMKDMYRGDDNTIHFKVLDEYYGDKTENTFVAEIRYSSTSQIYRVECPITFTKDGEQGTQGSDWVAPIYSCNTSPTLSQSSINSALASYKEGNARPGVLILSDLQVLMKTKNRTPAYAAILDTLSRIQWPNYDSNNHTLMANDLTYAKVKSIINEALAKPPLNTSLQADEDALVQDYYNFRMNQWELVTTNDIIPSYHQRNEQPTPLILIPKDPNDLSKGWKQDPNNHVVFRPFVAKNGVMVEEMNPYDGYCYKVYWDVRFDQRHKKAPYGSFLRLHHLERTDGDTIYKWANDTQVNAGNGYEYGNAEPGICREFVKADTGDGAIPANDQANGLIAYNAYPSTSMWGTNNELVKEQYGAVEVRFADDQDWDQFNFEDGQYVFFIKARIEIYKDCWDEANDCVAINSTAKDGPIAVITSWHPVDVFLNPGNITFDSSKLKMNWPTFVVYDSNGRNPVVSTSSSGTQELTAYYSDVMYDANGYELYRDRTIDDPDEEQTNNKKLLMTPINNTPDIAKIVTGSKRVTAMNGDLEAADISVTKYTYNPSECLNWQYGMISSMRTTEGICDENGQDPWNGGTYIRCQIMTLNKYGNTAINGWDGSSINLDKEKGVILAPTIGAGYKDKATNLFTGVIMGVDTQWKKRDFTKNWSPEMREAHGYDEDDMKANPYMAGLYGYQRGASTFGLMENGTAFFGRADRGGRIIIDGYNATMYGGANGWYDIPKYNDPMWNTMRLSFVDLYHRVDKDGSSTPTLGFEGEFYQESDFPDWLKRSWRNAYVVAKGQLPYWFQRGGKEGAKITDVKYWYSGEEDFNNYWKDGAVGDSDLSKNVAYNARINYWDNGYEYQPWKEMSFAHWIADTGSEIPAPKVSITNETRRLNDLYTQWSDLIYKYVQYLLDQWDMLSQYSTGDGLSDQYDSNNFSSKAFRERKIAQDIFSQGDWNNVVAQVLGLDETLTYAERIRPYSDTNSDTYKVMQKYLEYGEYLTTIDFNQFQHDDCQQYTDQVKGQMETVKAACQVAVNEAAASYEELMKTLEKQMNETLKKADSGEVKEELTLPRRQNICWDDNWCTQNCVITKQQTVFGPSRASTTPAIEIGQHVPGLRPGRITIEEYEDVMKNMEVPGNRNFMVTYDGTMWCMNGVFMGNVVGSNIVGGSIIGGDLQIGMMTEGATYYKVDSACEWPKLWAPTQTPVPIPPAAASIIKPNGAAMFSSVTIYNGNINIGGFHVIGYDENIVADGGSVTTAPDAGHLIQFGESDFIGPSHFYGNVGIGPNRRIDENSKWFEEQKRSSLGNLFQTFGQVALAVMIPNMTIGDPKDGDDMRFHAFVAGSGGQMSNNGQPYTYEATNLANGTPLVNSRGPAAIEAYSMFGLDSLHRGDYVTEGHFWPMAFKYNDNDRAYFTTMNIFRNRARDNIIDGDGSYYYPNFFRVGPYGCEATQIYFRKNFKSEYNDELPDPDDDGEGTYGFVGYRSMSNWGGTSWAHATSADFAMGLSSWKGAHVIIKSDMDTYFSTKGSWRAYGAAKEGDNYNNESTWYDAIDNYGAFLAVGDYYQNQAGAVNSFSGTVSDPGTIGFAARDGKTSAGNATAHQAGWNWAGFEANPKGSVPRIWSSPDPGNQAIGADKAHGTFVYTRGVNQENEIHIVRYNSGDCCIDARNPEVMVGDRQTAVYHPSRLVLGMGGSMNAHTYTSPIPQGLLMTPTEFRLNGYTAEQQWGVYARFA